MTVGIDARLWDQTGVGRYIRNLCINLQKTDNKNKYVIFARSSDIQNIKVQITNPKWKIVETNIKWHSLSEQINFPKVLGKENLDLMHFPYFSVPIFYNRPFVVTIHDLILHHFPTGKASTLFLPFYYLKLFGYKFVISNTSKKAKKIIAVSNATREEIIDHLKVNENKITVIYEAVDENIINHKSKIINQKYGKYFLYVGNAYPHKNLERLIDALSILRLKHPDISLILVGREDYFYKRMKHKVSKMEISDSIKFYGQASDEELQGLYKNAKAVIIPSLMEGFGLPALEAMSNKCLVLASDIPSLKEVCTDAAIYFNPYSVDELVKNMEEIYFDDSSHFSDNIQNGIERVKIFSWEKMAKETLGVYESCISI